MNLALVRTGVVLVLWAEWMGPLRPVHHLSHPSILVLTGVLWLSSPLLLVGWFSQRAAAVTGVSVLALWVAAAPELSGGGVVLASAEAWALGVACCALALTPCGAAWSVDAHLRPNRAVDWGGRWVLKALFSWFFLQLAWRHSAWAFLDGTLLEQVVVARYGAAPTLGVGYSALGILWWMVELSLGLAPWLRWGRRPVLGFGFLALGLGYAVSFLGSFVALAAVLALALLEPEDQISS